MHAELDAPGPLGRPRRAALASSAGSDDGSLSSTEAAVQAADLTPDRWPEDPAAGTGRAAAGPPDVKDSIADLFRGAKMICVSRTPDARFFCRVVGARPRAATRGHPMGKERTRFGHWPSPITTRMAAAGSRRFGALQAEAGALYWSESRPEEQGRQTLLRGDSRRCGARALAGALLGPIARARIWRRRIPGCGRDHLFQQRRGPADLCLPGGRGPRAPHQRSQHAFCRSHFGSSAPALDRGRRAPCGQRRSHRPPQQPCWRGPRPPGGPGQRARRRARFLCNATSLPRRHADRLSRLGPSGHALGQRHLIRRQAAPGRWARARPPDCGGQWLRRLSADLARCGWATELCPGRQRLGTALRLGRPQAAAPAWQKRRRAVPAAMGVRPAQLCRCARRPHRGRLSASRQAPVRGARSPQRSAHQLPADGGRHRAHRRPRCLWRWLCRADQPTDSDAAGDADRPTRAQGFCRLAADRAAQQNPEQQPERRPRTRLSRRRRAHRLWHLLCPCQRLASRAGRGLAARPDVRARRPDQHDRCRFEDAHPVLYQSRLCRLRRQLLRQHRLRACLPATARWAMGYRRRGRLRGGGQISRPRRPRRWRQDRHFWRQRRRLHDPDGAGDHQRVCGGQLPLRCFRSGAVAGAHAQVRIRAICTACWERNLANGSRCSPPARRST